jgi:hypothetical protein
VSARAFDHAKELVEIGLAVFEIRGGGGGHDELELSRTGEPAARRGTPALGQDRPVGRRRYSGEARDRMVCGRL